MHIYDELSLDRAALELELLAPLRSLFQRAGDAPDTPSHDELERGLGQLEGLSKTILRTLDGLDEAVFFKSYGQLFEVKDNPIPKLRTAAESILQSAGKVAAPTQTHQSRTRAREMIVRYAAAHYEKVTGQSPIYPGELPASLAAFVIAIGEDVGAPDAGSLPRVLELLRRSGRLRTKPR
ncbi:MAG: hypothetical protein WBN65_05050 [Gammaproteobacteria bacterium]